MANSSTTSAVYLHVIEDVISKVREEFLNNGGAGEDVLSELQGVSQFLTAFALYLVMLWFWLFSSTELSMVTHQSNLGIHALVQH